MCSMSVVFAFVVCTYVLCLCDMWYMYACGYTRQSDMYVVYEYMYVQVHVPMCMCRDEVFP